MALLKLPPLRERAGDLGLLADRLLDQINAESVHEPAYRSKKLSVSARNILLQHPWPGNVRELSNTLLRAAIWSDDATIRAQDLRDALLPAARDQRREVWDRPLGNGLSLPDLLAEIARHYLARAMAEAAQQQDQSGRAGRPGKLPDLYQLAGQVRCELMSGTALANRRRIIVDGVLTPLREGRAYGRILRKAVQQPEWVVGPGATSRYGSRFPVRGRYYRSRSIPSCQAAAKQHPIRLRAELQVTVMRRTGNEIRRALIKAAFRRAGER